VTFNENRFFAESDKVNINRLEVWRILQSLELFREWSFAVIGIGEGEEITDFHG
jgi:hypothetical protein